MVAACPADDWVEVALRDHYVADAVRSPSGAAEVGTAVGAACQDLGTVAASWAMLEERTKTPADCAWDALGTRWTFRHMPRDLTYAAPGEA